LQDELTAITAYLEIAKSRFGDRLTIAINIDDATVNTLVPALSLQPLVENALNHGLFPKLGHCFIAIESYIEDDALIITITDNGVGIPPDRLAQIQTATADGIGITNVNKRLTSIYGPEYGLSIISEPAVGTEARLRIPLQHEAAIDRKEGVVS